MFDLFDTEFYNIQAFLGTLKIYSAASVKAG